MDDDDMYTKGDPFSFFQGMARESNVVANDHHKERPVNSTFKGGKLLLQKNCDYCDGKEYVFDKDTIRCTTCGVKYFRSRNKYYIMYKTIPKGKETKW